ncbi:PREDICTED: LOW QUALITY PROTEIN: cyclin-dependent kinase inhibitor 1B, partial [Cariama cristata]|uniref:LOW QUALITY PROTEIN: cyclin-dependent kinase inhibitor 1B n=1 Tax=Cariama cristata TaxID=54380 RepID=UPI00051FFBFF
MSNVHISNGSPSLERMEARQSEYLKPSACRNIFRLVDHAELNRDLKKHCQEMEEACQRKWIFDFQNHKLLEGMEKESSPNFYFRPSRLLKAVCKSTGHQSLDVKGNCQTMVFVGSQGISEETHCVDQKTDDVRKQTLQLAMDFAGQCTGQRKRPATNDSSPQIKEPTHAPLAVVHLSATPPCDLNIN